MKFKDTKNYEEMERRNEIFLHLVYNSQIGTLTDPFNKKPPFHQDLMQMKIPKIDVKEIVQDDFKLPLIMQNSPDQGAFLVSQPIPKCGAFAYIAVVSRPPKK
jgi:hypothetical protein